MLKFNEYQKYCNNCSSKFIATRSRHICNECYSVKTKKYIYNYIYCNHCGEKLVNSNHKHYCNKCFEIRYPPPKDWDRSDKNCINCNKLFKPKQPNNTYCSTNCRTEYHKEQRLKIRQPDFERNCAWCNNLMVLPPTRKSQKFCSEECKENHWKKIRDSNKTWKPKIVNCKVCNKEFKQQAINAIYCSSPCRVEANRIRVAINQKKYAELNKYKKIKTNFTNFNDLSFANEEDFHHWFNDNFSLFGLKKLIKTDRFFPDVIAETHDGIMLRIELELVSNNFIAHGHKPGDCDLIICFVNSRRTPKIKGVPVLSIFYTNNLGERGSNDYDHNNLELTEHFQQILELSQVHIKKFTDLLKL